MDALFDTAPGFDQPLAVLKHCHDRIRKQLATLGRLPAHLASHGVDRQAQQAAQAILRYFQLAAPLHHEDEEIDLLPRLSALARNQDAALLHQALALILQQHGEMAQQWTPIEAQLLALAGGKIWALSTDKIAAFQALYQEHMALEESQIAPMAARLFDLATMQEVGAAMQARRHISTAKENDHVD